MVSTTTQQDNGLSTDTKRVSLFVAVMVLPTVPFDQTKVGLLIDGALAVITDVVQVAFWLKMTAAVQGET
jgi:hypothetical protein